MSRPRKISELLREKIADVARRRRELPTDKQLADEAGCSVRAVQKVMRPQSTQVGTNKHGRIECSTLETLAEIVKKEHEDRLDQPHHTPMVPRRFKQRSRPKTALISQAALRKDAEKLTGN